MPTIITEEALPNNTIVLTMAFTDEDGNAVIPEDPTTWSLTDIEGTAINAQTDVAIVEAAPFVVSVTYHPLNPAGYLA